MLRPGGRAGITDVTLVPGRLDGRLSGLAGWVACLADARPLEDYHRILARAGLRVTRTEQHDDALARMIDQIEARLRVLRMAARMSAAAGPAGGLGGIDADTVRP